MQAKVTSHDRFNETLTTMYLDHRSQEYNPKDHLDPIFFPISKPNMASKCNKFKDALNAFAESNASPVPNMDDLDYEPDSVQPSNPVEEELMKLISGKKLNYNLGTITENGDLQQSFFTDLKFRSNSWLMPTYTKQTAGDLVSRTINLNPVKFDTPAFNGAAAAFQRHLSEFQRLTLNINCLSFCVDTIKMTKRAYDMIIHSKNVRGHSKGMIQCDYSRGEELVEVPVSFTISNQLRENMHFRLDIYEEKSEREPGCQTFHFGVGNIPDEVVRFWRLLPALYSDGADKSIKILNGWLKDYHKCDVQFKAFDIANLAVVAGVQLDTYSLSSLSLVSFSRPFGDWFYGCDNSLALDRNEDNDSDLWFIMFKYYRLAILDELYTTLYAHILRTFWPDPDITLSEFNMTQPLFVRWWSDFLSVSLIEGKISASMFDLTRVEMIKSLNPDSKLIQALSELWIPVPAITYGGPRFLHSTRHEFKRQYYVVRQITIGCLMGSVTVRCPDTIEDIKSREDMLLYGRKYSVDDSGLGIAERPRSGHSDLHPNPQFTDDLFVLDVLSEEIDSLKPQNNQSVVMSLLEWARLDVGSAGMLMGKLRSMSDKQLFTFWAKRPSLYTGIRNTIYNTTGTSEHVPALEHLLLCSKENVSKELAQKENKAQLSVAKKRRFVLEELSAPDLPVNPGLHQAVYKKLPGVNTEKNRERRRQRNKLRQSYKGQPDYESATQVKQKKLYNKLVTRDKFGQAAGTPGTVVSQPLTDEPVPSTSKAIAFDSAAKNHDGPKLVGKKKFKKSVGKKSKKPFKGGDLRQKLSKGGDLRQTLINKRNKN